MSIVVQIHIILKCNKENALIVLKIVNIAWIVAHVKSAQEQPPCPSYIAKNEQLGQYEESLNYGFIIFNIILTLSSL